MLYLRLFWEFFKTGLFAIGGGMATVPFLFSMGQDTGWFSASSLADMIAVSESTPGPIGVNMATYVGYSTAGIAGGLVATLGLVAPSLIIILILASILKAFGESRVVRTVFRVLRAAVIGLLAYAWWQIASIALFDSSAIIVFVIFTCGALLLKKIHPVVWIVLGAAVGLLFF